MIFILEAFFSGCISKVINDGKDYSWSKIKSVINDRHDHNISTKKCRVIEKALNIVTGNTYKNSDDLYIAIEKIFSEFKNHGDTFESVKSGLNVLGADASDQRCENFLEEFYQGIRRDDDLYKAVILDLGQRGYRISQEEFRKLNEKIDNLTEIVSSKNDNENDLQKREPVKSRTQEYADKWNENMFLNNFDEWDENAGVNVKLSDVYLENHLPHFIWGSNSSESTDLKKFLSKYIYNKKENKMLLILGQPGIGKSTLITWIAANFTDKADDILVYRFASDLRDFDWQSARVLNRILEKLGFDYEDLNRKTIILDGLDEVSINNRREVLDGLYDNLIYENSIKEFSLIITCRENYVQERDRNKGTYIILQPWDDTQIRSFRNVFQKKTKINISENTLKKIIESKDILGIPLILYMILALNISIEKEGSIVDVYDKIFALEGGIYDRCINNRNFAGKHRISEIKEQIHQISKDIAMCMFENNSEEAYVTKEEYQKICNNIVKKQQKIEEDILIGNFFKLVKYCEGIETEELYFVHRSIYEYFVAETIYSSVEKAIIKLTEESQEELAGNIAVYLCKKTLTETINEYLVYKILKLYNDLSQDKKNYFFQWWEETIEKMMNVGMFYYAYQSVENCKNRIRQEMQCFRNLLDILRGMMKINKRRYIMRATIRLKQYIEFCRIEYSDEIVNDKMRLDFKDINLAYLNLGKINLSNIYLENINLKGAHLSDANLSGAYLRFASFKSAKIYNANLTGADLTQADFRDADLTNANLTGADLNASRWYVKDVLRAISQLKTAEFRYIIVEDQAQKKLYKDNLLSESNLKFD